MKPFTDQAITQIVKELIANGNLKIVCEKKIVLTDNQVCQMYPDKIGSEMFSALQEYMTSGESTALIIGGDEAVRKLLEIKGKGGPTGFGIRKIYSTDRIRNIMHTSDSEEEALREIKVLRI